MTRHTEPPIRTIIAIMAVTALVGMLLVVAVSAAATPSMQEVPLQGGRDTDQCDPDNDGWHFIATRADASQVQGSFVWVVHADGTQHDVPLDRLTGKAAHYLDVDHGAAAGIVGATLHIAQGWDGRFVLSHRPCTDTIRPTPTETETLPPGECPSTAHGCTPPPPRTETPSPTETPTETTSPSPSEPPSPTPTGSPTTTSPTSSSTPSTPVSPTPSASPTVSPPTTSSPTSPTVSPSTVTPSAPLPTSSTTASEPTTTTAAPAPTSPPATSSTPRTELAHTGLSASLWLLGAGAVVAMVAGAAFASFAGRTEGRR